MATRPCPRTRRAFASSSGKNTHVLLMTLKLTHMKSWMQMLLLLPQPWRTLPLLQLARLLLQTTAVPLPLPPALPVPPGTARSAAARTTRSAAASQEDDVKTFSLAAAGDPAAPQAAPANSTNDSETRTTVAVAVAPSAIVQAPDSIVQATGGIIAPTGVALPPALDWDDCDAPFDVGIQLDFHAPTKPLCPLDSDKNGASSSSDDDSIFIDLSRD
jgi:hypothetical protein